MIKVYIMSGIPGSGKSTAAHKIAGQDANIEVFSSDDIRQELFGDPSCQLYPQLVFEKLYSRAREAISAGKDIIIDATNLKPKVRKNVMRQFKDYDCEFIGVAVERKLDVCLRQNDSRDRHVPHDVIKGMYRKYVRPSIDEGFSEIIFM